MVTSSLELLKKKLPRRIQSHSIFTRISVKQSDQYQFCLLAEIQDLSKPLPGCESLSCGLLSLYAINM
jgi:hypothetical protein